MPTKPALAATRGAQLPRLSQQPARAVASAGDDCIAWAESIGWDDDEGRGFYELDEWQKFEERLAKLPQFEPSVMTLRHLYVGGAMECPIDKQGRVLIPPVLREFAKLERDAYWVGAMRMLEIWSKPSWQEVVEPAREKVDGAVLAKLGELGI